MSAFHYEKAGIHFVEIILIIWNKQEMFELKMCPGYGGALLKKLHKEGKRKKFMIHLECVYCIAGSSASTNKLLHLKETLLIYPRPLLFPTTVVSHKLQRKHLCVMLFFPFLSSVLFLMRRAG